jgi:putative salt-induced outer membrane protein YdiY
MLSFQLTPACLCAGLLFLTPAAQAQDQPPPPPPAEDGKLQTGDGTIQLAPPEEPWCPFLTGWDGGVELGLNGSTGNSETFNVRGGANAERKTDLYVTKFTMTYERNSAESEVTKNRFEVTGRNDWILEKGSPWRIFLQGGAIYDDFQDWHWRLTTAAGIGYAFIENERTTLVGRAGLGLRRDLGGDDNRIHPEGVLGADLSHKITERQLLTASLDFFPSLLDLSDYRVVARAAWELIVDPEIKMSLKIGVEDRYDSDPGMGTKHNDFSYFALLVWSF